MAIPAIQTIIEGDLYWTGVDVVDIAVGTEGLALRAALDQFDVVVRRFPIGQARHLLKLLSGDEPAAPYVILCCHGNDGGILLPELSERFEATQPVHGILTADALRNRVHLPDRVVIATGCKTGNPELAQAFLDGGCAAYIGPASGPYGSSVMVAISLLFYELMRGRNLVESMTRVRTYDDELSMWQLWERRRSARWPTATTGLPVGPCGNDLPKPPSGVDRARIVNARWPTSSPRFRPSHLLR